MVIITRSSLEVNSPASVISMRESGGVFLPLQRPRAPLAPPCSQPFQGWVKES